MAYKKHLIKQSAIYALCITIMVGIFLCPKTSLAAIDSQQIIELTNLVRSEQKLEPLSVNEQLTEAARKKAQAIFQEQRFSHTLGNRSFSAWIKDSGYEYSFVGENLAIDFATEAGAINAWLASPTHKANLLNPEFTETGIAVMANEFENNETVLVVQIFGKPLSADHKNAYFKDKTDSAESQSQKETDQELILGANNYLPGTTTNPLTLAQIDNNKNKYLPFAKTGLTAQRPVKYDNILFIIASTILFAITLGHYQSIERSKRRKRLPMCLENKEQPLLPAISYTRQISSSCDYESIAKNI